MIEQDGVPEISGNEAKWDADKKWISAITLGGQYHLIRPLESNRSVFIYLAVDRKVANLGMARLKVKAVEGTLKI